MGYPEDLEGRTKCESPATGALMHGVPAHAKTLKALPLRHSGNPLRNALTAISPQSGRLTPGFFSRLTNASHDKRKIAASA